MTNDLLTVISSGVLTLTLHRPEKKNALTDAMYRCLQQQLENAEHNPDIQVLILTGSGDFFTAGNDVSTFRSALPTHYRDTPAFQFMTTLAGFRKPVIAAVNGNTVGIGTTLLLHCDLVFCSETAKLQTSFLSLGLTPGFASTLLLPKLIGHSKAFELFTLRDTVSCQEMLALNLVTAVLPSEQLMPAALSCAAKLAAQSPAALQATKNLLKQRLWPEIIEAIDKDSAVFTELLKSPETQAIFAGMMKK